MFRGVGGGGSGFIVIHGTSLPWLHSRAFKESFKVPASLGGAACSHHPGSRAHITKQTGAPVLHAGLWYLCLWRSNHKGYRKMFTLMKKNSPCSAIFTSVHSQDVTGSDSFREWLVAFQQLLAVSPCSPTDTCLQIYFEVSRQVKMTIRLKSNILHYFNYRVAQWSPPEGANNISF